MVQFDDMAAAGPEVQARGPGWRKRLQEGFQVMTALYPACDFEKRLERATG
ncbi:hypothetical protein [Polaromonas sp.]|jgi:hypothetical protein|uniref:hypothetical protein n=1 Tax=Polaromonas sp. TaxID=1869339 RepID=UPI002BFAD591|nr:hypothetical protein [Polaromonas sp.]HQS30194.1 hypothetical protein [Polaromonas sp.]HQS89591.1 hypothetical protein [Polaromonas sp.]